MPLAWTTRRQLSYLGVVAVFALIILIGAYAAVRSPTCSDGVQNQDETSVDCGGICGECIGNARPLLVRWSKPFKVRDGLYEVLALIDNPNTTLGIDELPYEIKLFDKDNILVAARRGSTYVNPAELFGVLEVNIPTGSRAPPYAVIELAEDPSGRTVPSNPPRLALPRKEYVTDPFPRLEATIENRELTTIVDIDAIAVLYDARGTALSVGRTVVRALAGGARTDLLFSWPDGITGAVATADVIFRTNYEGRYQQTRPD